MLTLQLKITVNPYLYGSCTINYLIMTVRFVSVYCNLSTGVYKPEESSKCGQTQKGHYPFIIWNVCIFWQKRVALLGTHFNYNPVPPEQHSITALHLYHAYLVICAVITEDSLPHKAFAITDCEKKDRSHFANGKTTTN